MDSTKLFEEVQQAMVKGEPIAKYKKAILGALNVKILDQVSGMPVDFILSGNAEKGDESAFLIFWTPIELAYFERANKYHLAQGFLVPFTTKAEAAVENPNLITDEEITNVLGRKYFAIKKVLDGFTSPAPALRMLAMAEKEDKSVGTINLIKSRVTELQAAEFEKPKQD